MCVLVCPKIIIGDVAQLGERSTVTAEVARSKLVIPAIFEYGRLWGFDSPAGLRHR